MLLALLWVWQSARSSGAVIVPSPGATWTAIAHAWSSGQLTGDFRASMGRIGFGYAISMAIGLVAGLLMGSFTSVESATEAPIAFLRYIPATALTPLLLLWLGIGESPKVTLIVLGTVFFNPGGPGGSGRVVGVHLLQGVLYFRG